MKRLRLSRSVIVVTLLVLVGQLALAAFGTGAADIETGRRPYRKGDYVTALKELLVEVDPADDLAKVDAGFGDGDTVKHSFGALPQ